ncbi:hypothetical protein DID73_01685 [Candidatus Marinamargulisbacteria bacterium SCGC AG-343-K17]|nr:hypothetical protein DID73_01685 [Candidatus Marinamargulisbacteria bacterium SCGC AG-343-K17]
MKNLSIFILLFMSVFSFSQTVTKKVVTTTVEETIVFEPPRTLLSFGVMSGELETEVSSSKHTQGHGAMIAIKRYLNTPKNVSIGLMASTFSFSTFAGTVQTTWFDLPVLYHLNFKYFDLFLGTSFGWHSSSTLQKANDGFSSGSTYFEPESSINSFVFGGTLKTEIGYFLFQANIGAERLANFDEENGPKIKRNYFLAAYSVGL